MGEKILVVSPNCPSCEVLKERLSRRGLLDKYRVVDASTPEGLDFAKRLGILGVPDCVVVEQDKDGAKARRCTQQEFEDILK